MIRKVTFCDVCGERCERWYDLSASPSASDPSYNVADMLPYGSFYAWSIQICKPCFVKIFTGLTPREGGSADGD